MVVSVWTRLQYKVETSSGIATSWPRVLNDRWRASARAELISCEIVIDVWCYGTLGWDKICVLVTCVQVHEALSVAGAYRSRLCDELDLVAEVGRVPLDPARRGGDEVVDLVGKTADRVPEGP